MEPPHDPIFVFTDTLSVHRTLEAAAVYHEFREPLVAFNSRGDAFELPPAFGAAPIPQPGNRKAELIRRLRRQLILTIMARPDLLQMSKWDLKRAADDEIVGVAVRWFLIPDPPPREHWWQLWRPRSA